jgi:excisionase family DNA binding protein
MSTRTHASSAAKTSLDELAPVAEDEAHRAVEVVAPLLDAARAEQMAGRVLLLMSEETWLRTCAILMSGGAPDPSAQRPERLDKAEPADVGPTAALTVSIEEAAKMLGISRSQAYALANRGILPTLNLGGRQKRVSIRAIEEILAGRDPRSRA